MGATPHPRQANFIMWFCSFDIGGRILLICIVGHISSKGFTLARDENMERIFSWGIRQFDMTYLDQKYFSFHRWMGTTHVSLLSAKILAIWCYLPNSIKLSATSEGTAMWSRELKRCQGCFEKSRRWVCAAKSGIVWAKCETICWSEYYSVSKYPYVLVFLCTCCKCASKEQVCVCKSPNVLLH